MMSPEEKARLAIDQKLIQSGWVIQDMKHLNLFSAIGVAVREFPTSTGEVDYALFIDGTPVGIVEADRERREDHHGGGSVRTLRRQQIQMDQRRLFHPLCL